MILNYGTCIFDKFAGQTTKNVQGVRKIALKTLNICLNGALACFHEFQVFDLGLTYV